MKPAIKDSEWQELAGMSVGHRMALAQILPRVSERAFWRGYFIGAIVYAVGSVIVKGLFL